MLLESFTYGSQSTPFRPGKRESCEMLLFLFFFFSHVVIKSILLLCS